MRIDKIVSSPLDSDRAQMALSAEISALVAKNRCSLNPTVEFVQKLFDTHLSVNERIINYFRVEGIRISSASESVKSVASLKPISNYLETKEAKKATEIIEYFHSNEHSLNSIEHKSGPKTFNHKGGPSNPLSVRENSNPRDPTFQTTIDTRTSKKKTTAFNFQQQIPDNELRAGNVEPKAYNSLPEWIRTKFEDMAARGETSALVATLANLVFEYCIDCLDTNKMSIRQD